MFKRIKRPMMLWSLGIFGLALANIVYLSGNFIGWFITLGFFLLTPGYLLLRLITREIQSRWEVLSFALGLSILVLMLGGLALNGLHAFGLQRPLTTRNIFIALDIITATLLILNRKATFSLPHRLPHPSKEQIVMFVALTLLPFLAIGGAIRLNNGASNILTMILFALVAVLFIILIWRKNLQSLYPYAIIMMGLSILFSTSLRGWGITGHDIQREFYVFQLASKAGYWSISSFRNPYNACLSITILPAILAKITTISAPYIFKVVFQTIFAFGLVPVFLFTKRLSNAKTAFIGSFIFISFPTFLNDMPFLNRQETALLFFSLCMLATFSKMTRQPKTILSILCLAGLIISHYSSSYVTLGILILSSILYKVFMWHKRADNRSSALPLLSMPIILTALLLTFLWNTQITATTNGLKSTITNSLKGLIDHSSAHSEDVSYSIFAPSTKSPQNVLSDYAGNQADQVTYTPQPNLQPTKLGQFMSHIINPGEFNSLIRIFSARILQVLLIVGTVILVFKHRRRSSHHEMYFVVVILSCVTLLVIQTLLPQLSVDYGTLRFFQQTLIILAIPILIGLEGLLHPFSFKKRAPIASIFFVLLFLDLSGFLPQLIGNYSPQLSLNNSGAYYDEYYVTTYDSTSVAWMIDSVPSHSTVSMDDFAHTRFINSKKTPSFVVHSILDEKNSSYLFQDYANVRSSAYEVGKSGDILRFTFVDDITQGKNLVYNNGGAKVLE